MTLEHAQEPKHQTSRETLSPTDFSVQDDYLQRTLSERAHDPLPQPPNVPPYETIDRGLINWSSLLVRKIGGRIAAIVIGGVVGGGSLLVGHALTEHSQPDRTASAPAYPDGPERDRPTLDSATPDQFYSDAYFTDIERIGWAMRQLQEPSQVTPGETVERAAYDAVQRKRVANGESLLTPLAWPNINNTPNQFNVQYVVVEAAATYEPNSDKSEKLLAAIQDNQNPLLTRLRSIISDDHHNMTDAERLGREISGSFTPRDEAASQAAGHTVETATPVTTDQPLGNFDPHGTPSRIVQIDTRLDGGSFDDEELQSFVGGHWVVERAISRGSAGWIPPQNLVNYFSSEK